VTKFYDVFSGYQVPDMPVAQEDFIEQMVMLLNNIFCSV
jgi:cellulase/cellobiase CelA1